MNEQNPYAATGEAAVDAPFAERAAFLKKVYSLLLAGIAVFVATLWAAAHVEPVNALAASTFKLIYGSRWGILIYLGIFVGLQMLVQAFATRSPLNLIFYFLYAFGFAILSSGLILGVMSLENGAAVINQAAMLTTLIFSGLTAYVFVTRKDFSFMGGFLWVAMMSLCGISLAGAIFGFNLGLFGAFAGALIFALYILYDTSRILHHFPTNMAVSAACMLFTDIVLLFKNLVIIILSMTSDD